MIHARGDLKRAQNGENKKRMALRNPQRPLRIPQRHAFLVLTESPVLLSEWHQIPMQWYPKLAISEEFTVKYTLFHVKSTANASFRVLFNIFH